MDRESYASERFFEDTKAHTMRVLHDEGLYKHLRFRRNYTIIYYFDLVTWPGHLAITGDAGDFVFARTRDMVEFFLYGQGAKLRINPQYWSEKLVAPRPDGAMEFSQERYKQRVLEMVAHVRGEDDYGSRLQESIERELLVDPTSEHEAHRLLYEFEHEGWRIGDSWEWDLREFRFDFLWCCWAIVWGLRMYTRAGDLAVVSHGL